MKKDDLGNRMKGYYENRTRYLLPRRTYTIIRVDGKAFHSYTKGMERPFDKDFIEVMDNTASYLCENIQGSKLAFVQSDEISIVLTDFDSLTTEAFFDGNVQKIASISAGMASAIFNFSRLHKNPFLMDIAVFDGRAFTIPCKTEVINYFIWRQMDTVRNSIQMVAQSLYSHKELLGQNTSKMQELIFQKGINWNDYPPSLKRGRLIIREAYQKEDVTRHRWISTDPNEFTKDNSQLNNIIPDYL